MENQVHIQPVTIQGRYLWTGNTRVRGLPRSEVVARLGRLSPNYFTIQFMIRGVVYQRHSRNNDVTSGCQDPLADEAIEDLKLSMPLLKDLGVNTLFIYTIDTTKGHDEAMSMLANAGIYVLACLSSPRNSINRNAPFESYTPTLLQNYFAAVDCLAVYPNTLGIIVANEVLNTLASTKGASVIRAVTRDVKRYMRLAAELRDQRVLPVGLSSAKILSIFRDEFKYFTGGDPSEALDFFCFGDYSWVGKASMFISAYDRTLEWFAEAHLPVFFSEYGAKIDGQVRPFQETLAMYSPEMSRVYSGAYVYEFFDGANRYGLVQKNLGGKLDTLKDFQNLKKNLALSPPPETINDWASSEFTATRRPGLPSQSHNWKGEAVLPECPLDWAEIRSHVEDADWVTVDRETANETEGNLADLVEDRLNIR
ncbi:glycolipid anchored surface protein [Colletotrichum incanum]|uniref:1,3-beta-glucanosyltransferase n=1 Tax=Colletotrichum incanum TaxID=1573173 RepID=A0A166N908_COLIC|nr:glycolipid anchored surface protein [Colletotrichum incanum]